MKKRRHDIKTWLLWLGAPLLALLVGYFYLGPNINPEALDLDSRDDDRVAMPELSFEAGRAGVESRGETEVEILPEPND